MGQMHPSGSNPDQCQCLDALIPLENFMGNAGERPGDVSRIHHQPLLWSILWHGAHRPDSAHKKTFPSRSDEKVRVCRQTQT
jgi:hypothetical protein